MEKAPSVMPNHAVCSLLLACALTTLFSAPIAAQAEEPTPPPTQPTLTNRLPAFHEVAKANAAQLAALPAQGETLGLFKTAIGPQLGLNDATMNFVAEGRSTTTSGQFRRTDITRSANRIIR